MYSALLPLIGIIIGAFLQYYFSRHLENVRIQREARIQAYTDYLKSICELAFPNQGESTDGSVINARIADAKCRICLYGSRKAITAFALFEERGASISTPEQYNAFISMVKIMRKDSVKSANVSIDQLGLILFGLNYKAK